MISEGKNVLKEAVLARATDSTLNVLSLKGSDPPMITATWAKAKSGLTRSL